MCGLFVQRDGRPQIGATHGLERLLRRERVDHLAGDALLAPRYVCPSALGAESGQQLCCDDIVALGELPPVCILYDGRCNLTIE